MNDKINFNSEMALKWFIFLPAIVSICVVSGLISGIYSAIRMLLIQMMTDICRSY